MPERNESSAAVRPLSDWMGWALAVSAAICFLGARRSHSQEDLFYDSLSNEIHLGGGVTLLLVVLGLVLAVNAVTMLVWGWRRRARG